MTLLDWQKTNKLCSLFWQEWPYQLTAKGLSTGIFTSKELKLEDSILSQGTKYLFVLLACALNHERRWKKNRHSKFQRRTKKKLIGFLPFRTQFTRYDFSRTRRLAPSLNQELQHEDAPGECCVAAARKRRKKQCCWRCDENVAASAGKWGQEGKTSILSFRNFLHPLRPPSSTI